MAKKKVKESGISGWKILSVSWKVFSIGFSILMFLFFISIFFALFGAMLPEANLKQGNVAVIAIDGIIVSSGDGGFSKMIKSQDVIDLIEEAEEDDSIKAIMLDINSPGGTPVATDEISMAVKNSNKTTIAVIRETGASGAYWIATAADTIFANRMSVTGSIGVKASRLEFAGLLDDYNVTYRRLVAGRLKDAGTPFKEMTKEEQELYQKLLDTLHEEFITAVAENRELPYKHVEQVATGFVYLGSEAAELGLVDELGNKKDALEFLEVELGIEAEPVEYSKPKTFFEELSGVTSEQFRNIGEGMGSALISKHPEISFS